MRALSWCGGEAHMHGRADLLMRAVENIVRNAIRFHGKPVCVEVKANAGAASAHQRQRPRLTWRIWQLDAIFQPFYRSPGNPTGTGYGLGWPLPAAIESHGGRPRPPARRRSAVESSYR